MIKVWVDGKPQAPSERQPRAYTILPTNGRQPVGSEPLERISKDEIRAILAKAVQASLGIGVDEFIARYRKGDWKDPDGDPSISYLVALYQHTL